MSPCCLTVFCCRCKGGRQLLGIACGGASEQSCLKTVLPACYQPLPSPQHRRFCCSREPVAGLFTDVESKLAGAAAAHEERVRSSQQSESAGEAALLAAGSAADASSSSGDAAGGGSATSKEALVEKVAAKMGGTKDFLESHLMRASVLSPLDPDDPTSPPAAAAPAAGAIGGGKPAAGDGTTAAAAAAAASNGAANAAASGEEDDDDMHHAAGMGATAVSVVVRGNKVIVANTGG